MPVFVVDPWVMARASPNRVLFPVRQASRFDPAGEYVRRYLR